MQIATSLSRRLFVIVLVFEFCSKSFSRFSLSFFFLLVGTLFFRRFGAKKVSFEKKSFFFDLVFFSKIEKYEVGSFDAELLESR